jgi:hypothetical protein
VITIAAVIITWRSTSGLAAYLHHDPRRERLPRPLPDKRHEQAEPRSPLRDVERELAARRVHPCRPVSHALRAAS